uniref:Ig-like domain-containing protein n=1 Tax=Canis lupus familiaris TaxID=9615 RepID=A0A8P0T368_CANLF
MSWSAKQSITKRLLVTVLGLLCIQVCCVTGMEVEQRPLVESVLEGASPTLQCNFSTSATSVQWFRQDPGGHLVHLFYIPSGTKHNGRLNSTTVTKERRSSLYIFSSQTTDSAIYFCAVKPHCSTDTCCRCTNSQLGLAPPPATSRSGGHDPAIAWLTTPWLSWSPSLVLQIWDFGPYRPFSTWYLFFCIINL